MLRVTYINVRRKQTAKGLLETYARSTRDRRLGEVRAARAELVTLPLARRGDGFAAHWGSFLRSSASSSSESGAVRSLRLSPVRLFTARMKDACSRRSHSA